jgi:glutathione synthase
MKFLFVMDPIATVKPYKDTSYFLMLAAHIRGHSVYQCEAKDLYFHSQVKAKAKSYHIKAYEAGFTAS